MVHMYNITKPLLLTFRWHHFITSLNILLVRDALPERPLFATYLLKGINASVYGQCDGKRILGWIAGRGIGGSAGHDTEGIDCYVLDVLLHHIWFYIMLSNGEKRSFRVRSINVFWSVLCSLQTLQRLEENICNPIFDFIKYNACCAHVIDYTGTVFSIVISFV